MNKVIKVLLIIIAILFLCGALLIGIFVHYFDPNQFKPALIKAFSEQSKDKLILDGKWSLRLVPHVKLSIPHIVITHPNETSPYLVLNDLDIDISLWKSFLYRQAIMFKLNLANFSLNQFKANEIKVSTRLENEKIVFDTIDARVYDGNLHAQMQIYLIKTISSTATHYQISSYQWHAALAQMDARAFIQAFSAAHSNMMLTGKLDLTMDATTSGESQEQMLSNLQGQAYITIKNGEIQGVDMNYLLASADALMMQKPLQSPPESLTTKFDALQTTVQFANGMADLRPINLMAANFSVQGQGSYALLKKMLSLQLELKPNAEQVTSGLLKILVLPISIQGEINKLKVKVKQPKAEPEQLKYEVNRFLDKAKIFINERLAH